MKRKILFFLLMFVNQALATEILTSVISVVESQETHSILLLSGVDGKIYKAIRNTENLNLLNSYLEKDVRLEFENVENEAWIKNISLINADPGQYNLFMYRPQRLFSPTIIPSIEEATHIFKDLLNDGDLRRSECFKRAHMWAWDMWSKLGINSRKLFLFYTKRYQSLEKFDWWFHVAPLISVNGEEYVMDATFMQKPMKLRDWQHYFIKSDKINCPIIENYGEMKNSQWKKVCFLMKVPMFFLSPLDIENRDLHGIQKNNWILSELQDARKAFKNYEENYEALDTGRSNIKY